MSRSVDKFEITVDKDELLDTLKTNRATHQKNYKKALKAYREKCVELLEERFEKLQEDPDDLEPKKYLAFRAETPTSYTEVYDQIIEMLEMTDAETLVINGEQYKNWVRDEWDWTRHYAASTMSYLD